MRLPNTGRERKVKSKIRNTDVNRFKVAMLCQGTEVYGVGTVLKLYARGMPEARFVCMSKGPMLDWLREGGYRVDLCEGLSQFTAGGSVATLIRLPCALTRARRDARRLHELLKPHGISIVHTHWLPQQLIGGFMRHHGYRVVWHIHNNMNPDRLWGLGVTLNHRLARWGADLILPVSDFIADNWRGCGVPVRTVRNAAEPVYAEPNELPAGPIRTLVAGRISHSKGHHLAVDAVIRARNAGRDVYLDVFGGPVEANPYADGLKHMIEKAGAGEAIRLMGFCEDLRSRHQVYHLGLQCRIDPEPCSMWVCEALTDGLPLLASANGGTPELLEEGVTGMLFRAGDAADLAKKLIELSGDPDRINVMRRAAFERSRTRLSVQRFIHETVDSYAVLDADERDRGSVETGGHA